VDAMRSGLNYEEATTLPIRVVAEIADASNRRSRNWRRRLERSIRDKKITTVIDLANLHGSDS